MRGYITLPPDCFEPESKADDEVYRRMKLIGSILILWAERRVNQKGLDLIKLEYERQEIMSRDYNRKDD